jgi:ankyrin repeat protein
MLKNTKQLFDNIKNNKSEYILKILSKNNNIDINIIDNNGNYFIEYIIMNKEINLLEKILEKKNTKIDIIDNNGFSILYNPIKYDCFKIVDLLLKYNKTNIGISIIDQQDKFKNTPLHYSIIFKNFNIFQLLLKYNSDIIISDTNGNNALHISVYSKKIEIIESILKKIDEDKLNIKNLKNNLGETSLHIAIGILNNYNLTKLLINYNSDINVKNDDTELVPLIYSIYNNNIKITKLLIDNGANLNIQDYTGNTCFHHCFKENFKTINDIFFGKIDLINANLYNINLELPLHIAINNKLNNDLSKLISKTKLNFQDKNGNSPLILICKNYLWKKYKNILMKKKLNIFLKNKNDKSAIDFISKNDYNDFIDIVSHSYLYILRSSNKKWKEPWENICKNIVIFNNLNKEEKEIIIQHTNEKNNICINIIKNKLKSSLNNNSIPIKKNKYHLDFKYHIDNSQNKIFIYTGTTIDILFSMIYLHKKFKNIISCINNDLKLDNKLYEFLKFNNIDINKYWFINFQIIWINNKIYFPTNFKEILIKYKLTSKKFICPIGIGMKKMGWHSNYLLIDFKKKEIERFEPNGKDNPRNFNYNQNNLDNTLIRYFNEEISNFKYFKPSDFLPKIGIQTLSAQEINNKKITDPQGFCSIWSLWYIDIRLTYDHIDRKKLILKMIKNISKNNISFKDLIRNYSINVVKFRDSVLNSVNVNIDNWINKEIQNEKFNKIIKEIIKIINNLIF